VLFVPKGLSKIAQGTVFQVPWVYGPRTPTFPEGEEHRCDIVPLLFPFRERNGAQSRNPGYPENGTLGYLA